MGTVCTPRRTNIEDFSPGLNQRISVRPLYVNLQLDLEVHSCVQGKLGSLYAFKTCSRRHIMILFSLIAALQSSHQEIELSESSHVLGPGSSMVPPFHRSLELVNRAGRC